VALAVSTFAALGAAAAPTPAGAASVNENFAGFVSLFDLYTSISLGINISQPPIVKQGGSYTMSFGSGSQTVPTSQSGFDINYLNGLQDIVPVPAGATFSPGSLSTGLQWTYVNKGVTTHGAFDLTYCTAAGPGCTATPHSADFLSATTTPYIETSTGAAHFAAGGSLTLPGWSAGFTATGALGSSIQPTVSEFDTDTNLAGLGAVPVVSYPSNVFGGMPSSPPPYVFQPLATTTIGVPTPVVTDVLPNSGPVAGGSTVTLHGYNLTSPTKVTFGSKSATDIVSKTPDAVTVVAPAGTAGSTVNVQLTNSVGTSGVAPGAQFTYTNGPIVTGVSPRTGPPAGGTVVTISGQQLTSASKVDFGSTPATAFNVDSANSITATAPAGTGIVDVTVTNAQGTSVTSAQDRFSYNNGYWLAASDGGIFSYPGSQPFFGSAGGITLNKPVVGVAATPDAGGYWLAASDGGVFNYGDAGFFGSAGALTLAKPVVGLASTPDGFGYWLVASDGGVFSYGDAGFFGSTGGMTLNAPIVAIASTPDGNGYWLVASDGGVFAYGDAGYYGSMGGIHLNQPIVGAASTPDGAGYWLVASDGGVFSFGDAAFYGSTGGITLNKPVVGLASNPDGGGYWLAAADGGIFNYGSAAFDGSAGGTPLNQPVVGVAAG
jgi:IPT/TIG domain